VRYLKILFITGLIFITLGSFALAEEAKRTAVITDLEGDVEVKTPEGEGWSPASTGMVLNEKDFIRTNADSWVSLNLNGSGETAALELNENSQLMLLKLTKNEENGTQNTLLDLAIGKILIRAQKLHTKESSFEVKTPTSIVGVRGTVFEVEVEAFE